MWDYRKRELEEQFPGWHIWYVPRVNGPTHMVHAAVAAYQQRQPGASRRRDPAPYTRNPPPDGPRWPPSKITQ